MHISPAALVLGAPLVARAAGEAVALVGQGFSGLLAMGQPPLAADEPPVQPSLGERFEQLAGDLRDWLRGQGISGPFAIEVRSFDDQPPRIDVSGPQRDQIAAALHQRSDLLEQIAALLNTLGQNGPLGVREATAVIGDQDCSITY